MDDLFSNNPQDFENINKGKKKDEFEDIFSSSKSLDIEDIFSDSDKNNLKESETERAYYSKEKAYIDDEDNKYFEKGELGESQKTNFEDVSSGAKKPKKKKKKGRAKKIIAAVLVFLILCGVVGGGYLYKTYKDILGEVNIVDPESNQHIGESELTSGDGITNILLIGSDTRLSESMSGSRSDTAIILSIDTTNKQLKLTSFLRDTYVTIPDHGKNKLNAAFSKGGPQLLMDTLEYNFGVDIDNYVVIDFESFSEVVDALGGVEVEITSSEAKYINSSRLSTAGEDEIDILGNFFKSDISSGVNHLDGGQALWYCRIRKLDSDFYRTERQRKVLKAALTKAKTKNLSELISIAKLGARKVTTDLTETQISDFSQMALSLMKYEIVGMQVPADGTWSSLSVPKIGDCLQLDFDANKKAINTFIYGGPVVTTTEATTTKATTTKKSSK